MLKHFFDDPVALERLRGDPLGPHLESFAAALAGLGYATTTARSQIGLLVDLGRWLARKEVVVADLEEGIVNAFLDQRHRQGRLGRGHRSTVRRFLDHLQQKGVIPSPTLECDDTPLALLKGRYEQYLRVERGLTTATVDNYLPFVHRLLVERFGERPLCLRDLGPADPSRFILHHVRSLSAGRAKLMVTALRSFLRFLFQHGEIDADLAAGVPAVADWRQSTVPKYLTPEEVQRVLEAVDRESATGRRNYAIVLLLARLGLRAGEVVTLELDDIDWRTGEITVPGKGLVRDRLPLLADVGEALAAYLRQDRPRCPSRRVFIRARAPRRGFASAAAVTTIVERAVQRAGLHPPAKGAHLLRHSLATSMLRRGAAMTEIAQVLRHRAAATTEIYAKVDFEGLRTLAQPWPGSGGER